MLEVAAALVASMIAAGCDGSATSESSVELRGVRLKNVDSGMLDNQA